MTKEERQELADVVSTLNEVRLSGLPLVQVAIATARLEVLVGPEATRQIEV